MNPRGRRWVQLAPDTTRFFQLHEVLEAGTLLGLSPFGGRLQIAGERSRVVQVLFDVWDDRLTLVLEPLD